MKRVKYSAIKKQVISEAKDRIFKLKGGATPPTALMPVASKKRKIIEFFDEDDGYPKRLRYSPNQSTCIEQDQKGNVILSPLEWRNGLMGVPKENPTLQIFMLLNPDHGVKYVEHDKSRDAAAELEAMDIADTAYDKARQLQDQELLNVATMVLGEGVVEKLSIFEIKRDIRKYAKANPLEFMNIVDNPELEHNVQVKNFFKEGVLAFRNGKREVYFNLKDKKTRMLSIPGDSDPYEVVSNYLISDKGLNDLKMLDAAYDAKVD